MMKNDFYLKKYLIALYDKDDYIYAVADNISDLMSIFNISNNDVERNRMQSRISHALKRKNKKVCIEGLTLFVYLIPMFEEVV